jgi:hypothetical protein
MKEDDNNESRRRRKLEKGKETATKDTDEEPERTLMSPKGR